MGTTHRFLFDRSFDQAEAGPRAVPRKPPPEPTFTRADLEAARAQAAAEARKTAHAEALRSAEEKSAAALAAFAAQIPNLLGARERDAADAQRRCLEALRAVLRKIVPALVGRTALAEIEALVARCLEEAFDEPRIVLRIADPLFPSLRGRLDGLAAQTGFAGKIVLLADDALGPGDARIEWAEGGAERDGKRLLADIDAALGRAIDAVTDAAGEDAEEGKS